jgi:hypothetical protein
MPTLTAQLLASLDSIAFELARIETTINEAGVSSADASVIRRKVVPMKVEVSEMIEWIAAARLEEPQN